MVAVWGVSPMWPMTGIPAPAMARARLTIGPAPSIFTASAPASTARATAAFASDFVDLQVEEELPSGKGQGGLAGICLDPDHGYVFVTFAYQDDRGVLRNNIIRFETEPGRFGVRPLGQTEITEIFREQPSGLAHQIGPCVVHDGSLYVSVGEAWQTPQAQQQG